MTGVPEGEDERYRPGWSQGHLDGLRRAQGDVSRQERQPERVFLAGEAAITAAALDRYQRQAEYYRSYRAPAFQRRYLIGFVRGYVAGVSRAAKPPLHRRCAICGYVGDDVHPYRVEGTRVLAQWECSFLPACQARLLEQRERRHRVPDDYLGVL